MLMHHSESPKLVKIPIRGHGKGSKETIFRMEKKWIVQFILLCMDWVRLQSHCS
jgi:hypothetical protein